jgi:hypothetical protein
MAKTKMSDLRMSPQDENERSTNEPSKSGAENHFQTNPQRYNPALPNKFSARPKERHEIFGLLKFLEFRSSNFFGPQKPKPEIGLPTSAPNWLWLWGCSAAMLTGTGTTPLQMTSGYF